MSNMCYTCQIQQAKDVTEPVITYQNSDCENGSRFFDDWWFW